MDSSVLKPNKELLAITRGFSLRLRTSAKALETADSCLVDTTLSRCLDAGEASDSSGPSGSYAQLGVLESAEYAEIQPAASSNNEFNAAAGSNGYKPGQSSYTLFAHRHGFLLYSGAGEELFPHVLAPILLAALIEQVSGKSRSLGAKRQEEAASAYKLYQTSCTARTMTQPRRRMHLCESRPSLLEAS